MPVLAGSRVGPVLDQQRRARPRGGMGHGVGQRQLPVERFGIGPGIPVVHRSVPPQHMRNPGPDQAAHHRLDRRGHPRHAAGWPGLRRDLFSRATGRQEHQRRSVTAAQRAGQLSGIDETPPAAIVFQRQQRTTLGVDRAVTGQVQHLERLVVGQATLQRLQRAGLFDQQVQRRAPCGLQDRAFLAFERQYMLAIGRCGHEQHLQVAVKRGPGAARRRQPPHHLEHLHGVGRQW